MRRFTTKIYSVSALVLAISFFFVNSLPVKADYDYDTYYLEPWQVLSYIYWNNVGYTLQNTLNNSTNIAIPNIRTNTGNTNDRLICNASGTSYSCYYLGSSGNEGTFQFETTVAHNETEENISVHGAEIPWLSGNYVHDNQHVSNSRDLWIQVGSKLYISFISSTNPYRAGTNFSSDANTNDWLQVWSRSGNNGYIVKREQLSAISGGFFYTFSIENPHSTSQWVSVNFPNFTSNTKIIPIYCGNGNDIDDSIKQQIGIETNTEKSLSNISSKIDGMYTNLNTVAQTSMATNNNLVSGNPTSQAAQSALNNSNTTLNNRVDQMNTIETEYNSDLNAALDDIDLSTDLVQHTGFTNAALWVSSQFNRLVLGTPFELVITFSLITGLALVLIGKMRG